ncbi:MAG: SirB2 family protein [Enterobacterales bacterium]|nr:SirB2 family protein [Enterobacterales bacterium]
MEYYQLIKSIHIVTAIFSIGGFLLRSWWVVNHSLKTNLVAVKVLPHINDTLLLIAGILLVYWGPYSPIAEPLSFLWLIAKWIFLLVYIVAGRFALKQAKTKQGKLNAMILALTSILIILILAIYKPLLIGWPILG